MVGGRCRGRCGSPTRRARPGTGWRVRARRPGSRARWRRRRRSARAPADRVKTDRRDAERLARLLRLGELVAVRVPEPHEEAARDLVRAREDARGDLMRARHRLSKLLLRHGLVYDGERLDARARRVAAPAAVREPAARARVRRVLRRGAAGEDAPRRARRRRSPSSPRRRRSPRSSGRLCCLRGVSTLTALALDGRARRLDAVPAAVARPVPRPDPERGLDRREAPPGRDHQDRQHARPPAAGRGGLAPATAAARERRARAAPARTAGRGPGSSRPQRPPPPRTAGTRSRAAASDARSSRSPSRANSPVTAGRSRRWSSPHRQRLGEESAPAQRREERPAVQL